MFQSSSAESSPLRALPSVDELMRTDVAQDLQALVGRPRLVSIGRGVLSKLRSRILAQTQSHTHLGSKTPNSYTREVLLKEAVELLAVACQEESSRGIRRVINATGVVLHTNLGRAPLAARARRAIIEEAAGYCTLEYDLGTGSRSSRGRRVEELLIALTGAEDALVVNNCAAASLLILRTLAREGETIVSRGELVEIGGDFRVPDIMASSGARMVEVGTTNRTTLADYRKAVSTNTRLIMHVHPSNYRIVGFTTAPSLVDLVSLAHECGLPLYVDAGSGAVIDLSAYGLEDEPIIGRCLAAGADLVSFSGDKLLGSAQAGLIVGRGEIVGKLRRDALFRALRADKLTLAALETTLESFVTGRWAEIPVMRMLTVTREELEERVRSLLNQLENPLNESGFRLSAVEGKSAIGGGSGPLTKPASVLLSIEHTSVSAGEFVKLLRQAKPAVIARVAEGKVLLDLRTVSEDEESQLLDVLRSVMACVRDEDEGRDEG